MMHLTSVSKNILCMFLCTSVNKSRAGVITRLQVARIDNSSEMRRFL